MNWVTKSVALQMCHILNTGSVSVQRSYIIVVYIEPLLIIIFQIILGK